MAPGQNAAPLYRQLMQRLKEKPLDQEADDIAEFLTSRREVTAAQLQKARQLLHSRQDVMDLIHQAAERPACDFERDWSQGPSLLLWPELATMRRAARLLHAETYLLARDRRFSDAAATQSLGFNVAAHA